jgi:hypothetical protein
MIETDGLDMFDGYCLASRDTALLPSRKFFSIFPKQFNTLDSTRTFVDGQRLEATGASMDILFHGPYWFLKRGVYEITFNGKIDGMIELTLASRFGYASNRIIMDSKKRTTQVLVEHDLINFECVARAKGEKASVFLERLDIRKIA